MPGVAQGALGVTHFQLRLKQRLLGFKDRNGNLVWLVAWMTIGTFRNRGDARNARDWSFARNRGTVCGTYLPACVFASLHPIQTEIREREGGGEGGNKNKIKLCSRVYMQVYHAVCLKE